jgi:UDP-GlcNAc:undecaprenyl-phosphate GlcNAc-1-phosphate transferase
VVGVAVIGFAIAVTVAAVMTPFARRVGLRCGFVDRPTGWKEHVVPTPCLGGVAVLAAATAGALVAPSVRTVAVFFGLAWVFSLVGAVDDVLNLDVRLRLLFEAAGATCLWSLGFGWHLTNPKWIDLLATIVWVLVVVNSFNIIDLMDGLASSVIAAAASGIAVLAWAQHEPTTTAIALAVVGASLGFLPFNLTRPARIFLGDGGTMSLGFLVSALIPLALHGAGNGAPLIAPALLLFWVPLLDASYRVFTRVGRGVSLMTAGHDSLADTLQRRLLTPGKVSLLVCGVQGLFSSLGIGVIQSGVGAEVAAVPIASSLMVIYVLALVSVRPRVAPALFRR